MPKKKKQEEPGVPEWVVTYGDLMSLLLCFFILLQAFSEIKQPREYKKVVESVKTAFGYKGGVGVAPTTMSPENSNYNPNSDINQGQQRDPVEQSDERAIDGENVKVTIIEPGQRYTIGGPVRFAEGSAELDAVAHRELRGVARELDGRRQLILVQGHAYGIDRSNPQGWDLDTLSFQRAIAVKQFLVAEGLDASLISPQAMGDSFPAEVRRFTPEEQLVNRRAQVFLTEVSADEKHPNADFTSDEPD